MVNAVAVVRARGTRIGGGIYEVACQSQELPRLSKCKDSNAFGVALEAGRLVSFGFSPRKSCRRHPHSADLHLTGLLVAFTGKLMGSKALSNNDAAVARQVVVAYLFEVAR